MGQRQSTPDIYIQHHTAQPADRLRWAADIGIGWVGDRNAGVPCGIGGAADLDPRRIGALYRRLFFIAPGR